MKREDIKPGMRLVCFYGGERFYHKTVQVAYSFSDSVFGVEMNNTIFTFAKGEAQFFEVAP